MLEHTGPGISSEANVLLGKAPYPIRENEAQQRALTGALQPRMRGLTMLGRRREWVEG